MRLTTHCYCIPGLYYISPWNVNAGFIAGEKKTLVVDSGSNRLSAMTVYGYARAVKPDNQMLLINTERHLDHIGGNAFFAENGVPVYGHYLIERSQEEFERSVGDINPSIADRARRENREENVAFAGTKIANPGVKIKEDMTFDLGGVKAEVMLTPGHTRTNLSVYVKNEGVLYCGDLLLKGMLPNLEEGGPDEWRKWEESLAKIVALDPEFVIPGHGGVLEGKDEIARVTEKIREILRKAVETGRAPTGN